MGRVSILIMNVLPRNYFLPTDSAYIIAQVLLLSPQQTISKIYLARAEPPGGPLHSAMP